MNRHMKISSKGILKRKKVSCHIGDMMLFFAFLCKEIPLIFPSGKLIKEFLTVIEKDYVSQRTRQETLPFILRPLYIN